MTEIHFHLKTGDNGFLTNFYPLPRPLLIDGREWFTTEHYFQAQKFITTDPVFAETIRLCKRPYDAWRMAKSSDHVRRPDWDAIKEDVMRFALRAKFEQNPELRELLLATGEARLVEHTPTDSYWGNGAVGEGLNRLGELLMELRSELRNRLLVREFRSISGCE